jgi:hypothetical protein
MSIEESEAIRQFVQERIIRLKSRLTEIDKELEISRLKLLTMLTEIAVEQAKPLTVGEFVSLAWKAGCITKTKCFSGLILAAIRKLVSMGVLARADAIHGYYYVSPSPAIIVAAVPLGLPQCRAVLPTGHRPRPY